MNPEVYSDLYEYSTDLNALDIKEHFRRNPARPGVSLFELGIDNRRFDLIHINPWKQYVRIFEIKSSRQDFIGDKKWQGYLKYCHTFSFVCPHELIQKNDVPPGIGLLWIYKWKHKGQDCWNKEHEWHLGQQWIKRPKRHEMDSKTMVYVAFLMVERMISRKHDVF